LGVKKMSTASPNANTWMEKFLEASAAYSATTTVENAPDKSAAFFDSVGKEMKSQLGASDQQVSDFKDRYELKDIKTDSVTGYQGAILYDKIENKYDATAAVVALEVKSFEYHQADVSGQRVVKEVG
tara:strand:+ start:20 stop:400 length:381 start_codon:yes stop_codon:yes gene_type:complete